MILLDKKLQTPLYMLTDKRILVIPIVEYRIRMRGVHIKKRIILRSLVG